MGKDYAGFDDYGPILPAWEQSYSRSVVFDDSPQVHLSAAGHVQGV